MRGLDTWVNTMKALLIHLSDLHIKSSDNPIFERIEHICKAVQNLTIGVESIFLIVTGDIGYSGSSIEYKEATKFIKKIIFYIFYLIFLYSFYFLFSQNILLILKTAIL